MLTKLKWRIILSLSNVLIAVVLFAVGLNEKKILGSLPPHSNPVPEYIPAAQVVSYSMNLPPFVF